MISMQAGKAETGASRRNRHILCHAISIVFIILVSLVLFYKHFATRGMLMHVDMTFPTTISRNLALYNHTWWEYGSVQNIWNVQRVFWAYPLLAISKLFSIATDRYLLIMFIGTFALAGASMYALAFYTIKRFGPSDANRYAPYVGAIFAAIIFMYNPFSVSHLWPYFGYPGYAVLPLAFLLLFIAVERPKVWSVVLLAILITVAGTGPINVIWFWFMIVAYLVFYIISKRFDRRSMATVAKVFFPLAALYSLLNAVWMVPYFGSQLVDKPFAPVYQGSFNRQMLDMLSKSGTVLNNVRFTAGWGLPVNPQPSGIAWTMLSFALPVFALIALVFLGWKVFRNRVTFFWSIMFVISVLLATGTSSILARPYSWFVLKAPGLSSFGWVFRAADRWLIYAAVFYALILGLFISRLLQNLKTAKYLLAALVVALVLISFAPKTFTYAKSVYNPTQIPADYARVYRYIEDNSPGARQTWMPFSADGFHYNWASEKRIGAFDVYTSNPSLNNFQDIFRKDNFYYWLESLFSKTFLGPAEVLNREVMLSNDFASKLLMPFSARYVVYDSSVPGYSFSDSFARDKSMQGVYKTGSLEVFRLNSYGSMVRSTAKTVLIDNYYDELALAQKLSAAELERVSFAESGTKVEKRYGAISIHDYKEYYDTNPGFESTTTSGKPTWWNMLPNNDPSIKDILGERGLTLASTDRQASTSIDTSIKASGKQSLRVENQSVEDLSIRSVVGSEIPVRQGDIYNIETSVKYVNSKWTHVEVKGFNTRSNKWVRLVDCPGIQSGTSGWKKTEYSFYMPAGISKIVPVLAAGWVDNPTHGPAISWFDDIRISRISDSFYTDMRGGQAPKVTFKQVSPEKYEVRVQKATEPFVLVFGEAYDPLWVARVPGGKSVDPVRLYSTITGFPVSLKGDIKMTVDYLPQKWFSWGLVVSLAVLALCLAYLIVVLIRLWRVGGLVKGRS